MLKRLVQSLRGIIVFIFYALNVMAACAIIFVVGIFKFFFPFKFMNTFFNHLVEQVASLWVDINSMFIDIFHPIQLTVTGSLPNNRNGWFLVMSNHQSWVDILILQRVFNKKMPYFKFFIKKQLFWVPLAGILWWGLGFPMLSRHSQAEIAKNPKLKAQDLAATTKSCMAFRAFPASIFNFVEGTRFTTEKQQRQNSPFKHLLKPKAGGVALVLNILKDKVTEIVNVTIAYPQGVGGFWDFICGRVSEVKVHVELIPVTPELIGDYSQDPAFQASFQQWLNAIWIEKDNQLEEMLKKPF